MIKKLVIHLGDCKAGSTSIQTILFRKAWTSQHHNVFYPKPFNHIRLAKSISTKSLLPFQARIFNRINNALSNSRAPIGILSAENFEFVDPQMFSDAIDKYLPEFRDHIQLITYVRPHAERLLASYSERVKKCTFTKSLEDFHEFFENKKYLFYAPRIERWKDVFGDRYHVKPMKTSFLREKDVVHDFFEFAFGDDDFQFTEPTRHNESVSLQDLALFQYFHKKIRAINNKKQLAPSYARLGSHLSMIMAENPVSEPSKLQLHKSLADKILSTYEHDAEQLDRLYFNDSALQSSLQAAQEKAIDTPQSLAIEDHSSPQTIRMLDCWLELSYRMIKSNPKTFFKLSKKPGR